MKSELILKELANILHNNKDKYLAHELIQKKLKDLCFDMNFIHNSLRECIMRKNFLYDAKNLFFLLTSRRRCNCSDKFVSPNF